jgi:hypothetical protein
VGAPLVDVDLDVDDMSVPSSRQSAIAPPLLPKPLIVVPSVVR